MKNQGFRDDRLILDEAKVNQEIIEGNNRIMKKCNKNSNLSMKFKNMERNKFNNLILQKTG